MLSSTRPFSTLFLLCILLTLRGARHVIMYRRCYDSRSIIIPRYLVSRSASVADMPATAWISPSRATTSCSNIHGVLKTMSTPSNPELSREALRHAEDRKRFHPPSSPIAFWLWKWKMTIQGTFALSMLESWEQFILSVYYT